MSHFKSKLRLALLAVLALVVVAGLAAGSFSNVFAKQSADDAIISGSRADDKSTDDNSTMGSSTSGEVQFYDTVKSITGSTWVIGGTTVTVNSATFLKGSPQIGSLVEVEGYPQADGSLLAKKIGVEDSLPGVADDNSSSMSGTDDKGGSSISDDSSTGSSDDSGTSIGSSDDSSFDDHGSGGHGADDGAAHDSCADHGGSSGHGSDD